MSRPNLPGLVAALLVLAIVAGAAGMAVFGDLGLLTWRRLQAEAAVLEARRAELSRANAALRAEVDALAHDPAAVERAAAAELGVAAPGTRIVVLDPARR